MRAHGPSGLFRYRGAVVVMTAADAHPAMHAADRRRFEHVSGAAGKGERSNFDKDFAAGVRRLAAGVGWGWKAHALKLVLHACAMPNGANLCGPHFGKQIRMAIQYLEQFHKGERRVRLAGFVAGERVDTATEYLGRLALVQHQLLAYLRNVLRVDDGRVHLFVELGDRVAETGRLVEVEDRLSAGRAEITGDIADDRRSTLVRIGDISCIADQLGGTAGRALHFHRSLKDTISTSSITVSFRYTSPWTVRR
ncbi:hypothetical protein EMIT0111MI5_10196 [Burkholderia sp. IT-111MI5]